MEKISSSSSSSSAAFPSCCTIASIWSWISISIETSIAVSICICCSTAVSLAIVPLDSCLKHAEAEAAAAGTPAIAAVLATWTGTAELTAGFARGVSDFMSGAAVAAGRTADSIPPALISPPGESLYELSLSFASMTASSTSCVCPATGGQLLFCMESPPPSLSIAPVAAVPTLLGSTAAATAAASSTPARLPSTNCTELVSPSAGGSSWHNGCAIASDTPIRKTGSGCSMQTIKPFAWVENRLGNNHWGYAFSNDGSSNRLTPLLVCSLIHLQK
mmetsp:Transcript_18606/g.31327  ORF Transcript_18606/g.31327 Transcript_18606/m.31327 type:complete len:275 (-) Transcript_18606:1475-2299(-)